MSGYDPKKVYIGGCTSATEEALSATFQHYGTIDRLWVAKSPPGFAFVWFGDERDAADAVAGLDGTEIGPDRVTVSYADARGTEGVVEFSSEEDRRRCIDDFDNTTLRGSRLACVATGGSTSEFFARTSAAHGRQADRAYRDDYDDRAPPPRAYDDYGAPPRRPERRAVRYRRWRRRSGRRRATTTTTTATTAAGATTTATTTATRTAGRRRPGPTATTPAAARCSTTPRRPRRLRRAAYDRSRFRDRYDRSPLRRAAARDYDAPPGFLRRRYRR
ncbi:hypothetical protein JL721_10651 [Aureococcus anophagefferens]|nr:hypothetical protein JL721_10651 [Aureococcus anophagefferens]